MTAWQFLSRWRALPRPEGWAVVSESGSEHESSPYSTHRAAQDAADRFNRIEQHQVAGWKR